MIMGLSDRRRVQKVGKFSRSITLPAKLKVAETVTMATGRLVVVDPLGEIDPEDLLEFMQTYIDPNLWVWIKEKTREPKNG